MQVVILRRRRVAWTLAIVSALVLAGFVVAATLSRAIGDRQPDLASGLDVGNARVLSEPEVGSDPDPSADPSFDLYEPAEEEEAGEVDEDVQEEEEDEEEDEDDNENGVFREGDFDAPLVRRSVRRLRGRQHGSRVRHSQPLFSQTSHSLPGSVVDINDCTLWSSELENLRPQGFSEAQVRHYQDSVRTATVAHLTASTWQRCGRPRNQYARLDDGSHVCARHRSPHYHLIQGELLSFYLSRLLGMDNVPVVLLSRVDPATSQWRLFQSAESGSVLRNADWKINDTVALIQWIDGLDRSRMPSVIIDALRQQDVVTSNNLPVLPISTLLDLLQWSDLIVFDYITGNYDRVASMQDTAEREGRLGVADDIVHNLGRRGFTGGDLWLLDNESGLLDAYSLMYGSDASAEKRDDRFLEFHRRMLRTMCLFRRGTVQRVANLRHAPSSSAATLLLRAVSDSEPLFNLLPEVAIDGEFAVHLHSRIKEVHDWMLDCQNKCARTQGL